MTLEINERQEEEEAAEIMQQVTNSCSNDGPILQVFLTVKSKIFKVDGIILI